MAAVYPDLPAPGLYVKRLNRGQAITGEFGIEKRCPKCTDFHPATAEFWHHCHKNTDGFHWWCKACECERKPRAKRATNQTTHREISL
ncbi:hypothetical protein BCT27_12635 [Enterovibrio norvegicus]|nr:hypothetical protein BCT27_12635 [Enterovibrio norvegicus]